MSSGDMVPTLFMADWGGAGEACRLITDMGASEELLGSDAGALFDQMLAQARLPAGTMTLKGMGS